MRTTQVAVLLMAAFTASPLVAQQSSDTGRRITSQQVFDSFVRLTAFQGKPASNLATAWPGTLPGQATSISFAASGAHRVAVSIGHGSFRDSTLRVTSVSFDERVADTLTLQRRVEVIVQQIGRVAGMPDRCSTIDGRPSALFRTQDHSVAWTRGLAGATTTLTWTVAPDKSLAILVIVGGTTDDAVTPLRCGTRLP